MDAAGSKLGPGYRLDRYELLCNIASGGMATVWLARLRGKRGFEKLFAIKTIRTDHISDANFQEMFLDEARIASRIIHPNVAQIVELGEQEDVLYLVMEFVDGDSLAKLNRLAQKRGQRLPPGVALKIMADVCDGLHAAHGLADERGATLDVVHRDVSPQNILVTTAGIAKVIDFGLVKAKNRSSAETQSGVVKGKIRYMAPEQLGGARIDRRADVWAVGMCLYELLSGIIPYANEDDIEVLRRLTSADPLPPFDLGLPAPLNTLLAQAIAKDPAARFASCAAMRKAIDATAKELGLDAGTDDVAEFLRTTLPDVAQKRADTIASAVAAADALPGSMSGQRAAAPVAPLTPLDAFAATEVGPPATAKDSDARSYGQTPSTTSLREQIGERRRGGYVFPIAGVIAAVLGAWLLWPRHDGEAPHPAASAPVATTSAPPPPEPTASVIELGPTPPPAAPRPAARPATTVALSRPLPSTSAAPALPVSDGGLSAAAQSAAAIMLAPKPTESAAPPSTAPSAATSDTPR